MGDRRAKNHRWCRSGLKLANSHMTRCKYTEGHASDGSDVFSFHTSQTWSWKDGDKNSFNDYPWEDRERQKARKRVQGGDS